MRRWNLLLLVMGAGLACGGALRAPLLAQVGSPPSNLPPAEETPAPAAPQAEPGEAVVPPPAAVDERTRTAGGALAAFMASRNYHSIRALKSVMTPRLQARFDQDSVPFNGKRGARIAAFDFQESDLKLVPPPRLKGAAAAARTTPPVPAPPPEETYVATVRTLWEEQGEAVEQRVESLRVTRQEDGSWRVGSLDKVSADGLRFTDQVPGVTTLRMALRAWHRRDLAAARSLMSAALLKKYQGREETLRAIFVGGDDPRHAAFQILELKEGALDEVAKVRLFETRPGQPTTIAGSPVTVRLVKKGPRWLLDAWD